MPNPLSMPCRHSGCPALLPRAGYCAAHARPSCKAVYDATTRRESPTLAEAARIRNSRQWQRVRQMHRDRQPLCCDPFGAHPDDPQPNQSSHHIQPLASRPDLAFDFSNLAGLCTACHARVERMERAGRPTAALFRATATA